RPVHLVPDIPDYSPALFSGAPAVPLMPWHFPMPSDISYARHNHTPQTTPEPAPHESFYFPVPFSPSVLLSYLQSAWRSLFPHGSGSAQRSSVPDNRSGAVQNAGSSCPWLRTRGLPWK